MLHNVKVAGVSVTYWDITSVSFTSWLVVHDLNNEASLRGQNRGKKRPAMLTTDIVYVNS